GAMASPVTALLPVSKSSSGELPSAGIAQMLPVESPTNIRVSSPRPTAIESRLLASFTVANVVTSPFRRETLFTELVALPSTAKKSSSNRDATSPRPVPPSTGRKPCGNGLCVMIVTEPPPPPLPHAAPHAHASARSAVIALGPQRMHHTPCPALSRRDSSKEADAVGRRAASASFAQRAEGERRASGGRAKTVPCAGYDGSGIQFPWNPNGTRTGRWIVATGAAEKSRASRITTSLRFASAS